MWATEKGDAVFHENSLQGDPLVIEMQDGTERRMLYGDELQDAVESYLKSVGRLIEQSDVRFGLTLTAVTFYPTISLDHGLFCRATPSFRNEERFDHIEYLCIDLEDKEYSRYGQLMAAGKARMRATGELLQFAIVRPFEQVHEITIPRNASAVVRARIQSARKRATGSTYNSATGTRLGRPYLADDPYRVGTILIALQSVLAAVHLIQDFNTDLCFYVADSAFYYR